jgi:hypothetical protein
MSQQFAVSQGASVIVGTKFFRGPCMLPDQVVEYLRSKKAGNSNHTALEDHIRSGFVVPVGATAHVDSDLLQPGVRRSEQPVLRSDNDSDPRRATPETLTVSTGEGGLGASMRPAPNRQPVTEPVGPQGGAEDINFPGDDDGPAELTNGVAGSRFNMTDEQLEGKSIDELNAAIIERTPMDERAAFKKYEDSDAARAHLQQDLVADDD